MKKILVLVLVALLISGVAFADSYSVKHKAYYREGHGQGEVQSGAYQHQPHRVYRLVRWQRPGTAAINYTISEDRVVIWSTDVSGDDGVTVTRTGVTGDSRVAGVTVNQGWSVSNDTEAYATEDVGDANWLWIQTYGPGRVLLNATVSAGETLCAGVYGGAVDIFANNDYRGKDKKGILGFAMDAITTGNEGQVFIQCD